MNESIIPDFRDVSSFEEIQDKFVTAAKKIICNHHLEYGASQWRITALELYLRLNKRPSIWLDPSTDKDDEQLNSGSWYVRQKKGPGYWRIDITAGSKDEDIHAGLLVRGIDDVDGPARALHKIIRGKFYQNKWPDEDIRRLSEIHGTSIYTAPLKLSVRSEPQASELWIGPRINLNNYEDKYRLANLRVTTQKTGKKEDSSLVRL